MYAIGTQSLIHRLDGIAKQVWYADKSAAGSSLERLIKWWVEVGLLYGYFSNGSNTRPSKAKACRSCKGDIQIHWNSDFERGRALLGESIGYFLICASICWRKSRTLSEWSGKAQQDCQNSTTRSFHSWAIFKVELDFKGNWLGRTLEYLEEVIHSHFIPVLTTQPPPGEHMREMLALLARLGGLGLTNPATSAKEQRAASQQISAPLIDRIIN